MDARTFSRLAGRFWAGIAILGLAGAAPAEVASFAITQAVQLEEIPPAVRVYVEAGTLDGNAVEQIEPRHLAASLGESSLAARSTYRFRESGEGVAYVFLVDVSRSLSVTDFDLIRKALDGWIQALRPVDRVAIVAFGDESRLVVDFTSNRTRLTTALSSLGPTDDRTVLHEALRDGLELCSRRDAGLPGRRVILVLSDGRDEGSGLTADDVLTLLRGDPVPIYAIGVSRLSSSASRQAYLDLLRRFAANSGGAFYEAVASDLGSVYDAIREDIHDVWVAEFTCPECRTDGEQYRLQIVLEDRGRVLSDGRSLRLLPVLREVSNTGEASPIEAADEKDEETSRSNPGQPRWLWLLGPLVAAFVAAGVWIAQRRREQEPAAESESPGVADGNLAEELRPLRRRGGRSDAGTPEDSAREGKTSGEFVVDTGSGTTRPPRPVVMRLVRLVVVRGTKAGRQYTITLFEKAVVGSRSTCDCVLQEPGVAPEQFEIYQLDGRLYIRNISATPETLIDGLPVTTHHPLRSGALVGNRDFIVRVVYEEARSLRG